MTAGLSAGLRGAVARHLAWIHRVTSRYPLRVIAASLVILLLCGLSIHRVRFETDFFKLFPSEKGALRLFLDTLEWSGSGRDAYFLLEGPRDRVVREGEEFAARLALLKVRGAPAFSRVTYRAVDPAEAASFAEFLSWAVYRPQLFLSPGELPGYLARLSPASQDASLARDQALLASEAGAPLAGLVAADPLFLREVILPRLERGREGLLLDPDSPYLISRDGRLMVIIGKAARSVKDMAFTRELVKGINEARRGFASRITCTGAQVAAVIDEAAMKRNIVACVLSSLAVVLSLFYLTYRRLLPTLLIPLILLFGVVAGLGVGGLFLSSIHIISFAFTALIIGLGTDYSIHLYDRYYSERSAGADLDRALHASLVESGHGIFTAAVTTAVPFLALMVSDVRALFELGLLVGLGVIFSLYATLFFLPPLLIYGERRFPGRPFHPLPGFGLAGIWRLNRRWPRASRLTFLALIAGAFSCAFSIRFEGDLKKLQPRFSEALLAQEKIERHLTPSPRQMLVAVEGADLARVLARGERVDRLVEEYRRRGDLVSFSSLARLVNSPSRQDAVAGELRRLLAHASPEGVLRRALAKAGFAIVPFEPALARLGELPAASPVPEPEAIDRLERSPLRGVVERHLMEGEGSHHLLFYLDYRGREFDQQAFLRDLAAVDPLARASSPELVSRQLEQSVRRAFTLAFLVGGAAVLLLLLSHFGSLAAIFHTLYPVLGGGAAMLGIMSLAGMRLNFMNCMVLVTILGMGSDYGLHLAHRVTSCREPKRCGEFVQSGRAVLLSALTTIAGFGSLAFSDYGALASIGSATNLGVGATAVLALVSLPAFFPASRGNPDN
ncbi:exporter [Geomonas sp. Red276]